MNAHPSTQSTRIASCGFMLLLALTLPACSDDDGGRVGSENIPGSDDLTDKPGDATEVTTIDDADLPVWEAPYSEEALEVFARCWNNSSEEACNAQEGVAIMVQGERMEQCAWRTRPSLRPSDTCWSDWSYCHIAIPDFSCGQADVAAWLPDVDSGRFVNFNNHCFIGIPEMWDYSGGPEPEHIDVLPSWPSPVPTCPPDDE